MEHYHELIDFAIHVFIVHNNKVLLRYHPKYKFWGGPAGHIALDQDPNEAAIKKTKQEVGLDIKLYDSEEIGFENNDRVKRLIRPMHLDMHHLSETHQHVSLVYYATCDTDKVIQTNDYEDVEWKWFSLEEIETMEDLWDDMRYYAIGALKELANSSQSTKVN